MNFMARRDVLSSRWPLHYCTENNWQHGRLRRRAVHTAWAQWLGRVPWELFVGLTFDPKRVFPVSEELASREAARWCNETGRIYRRPMGWVVAPERGTSGQFHAHALIIDGPRVGGALSLLHEAVGMWTARNGSIHIQPVDAVRGVTLYATKQAAANGSIVISDTLRRHRDALNAETAVSLSPD